MALLWVRAAAHPYTQQDWYHGGILHGGRTLYDDRGDDGMIHIGTEQAALDRIDPEVRNRVSGHERLYRVRLAPGTRVCPHIHPDYHTHVEGAPFGVVDRDGAGAPDFEAGSPAGKCDPDADAHAYVNTDEDRGAISLRVNPRRLRVVEDLGRHPFWEGADRAAH